MFGGRDGLAVLDQDGAGAARRTLRRIVVHLAHLASGALGDDIVGRSARVLVYKSLGARLGNGVSLHGGTYVSRPAHLVVGEGAFINRNCYLDLEAPLVLGSGVTVGHGTTFVTTRHAIGPSAQRCGIAVGRSIVVGDGCWIGANVTVLPGVTIGPGAVVAAGAVVYNDVPRDTLVAGVPAQVRKSLEDVTGEPPRSAGTPRRR